MSTDRPNLMVLLSGSGRTLENLIECIDRSELEAHIPVVVGSSNCLGIDKAQRRGIESHVHHGGIGPEALDAIMELHEIDWVVLAGYLKLLPITERVKGRAVNIHPALLPDFGGKGMHGQRVHRAVLDAFRDGQVTQSGCTVHYADEAFDTGAIIEQRRCDVLETDTPESLAARVFELECECYPSALRTLFTKARNA